jgi:D-alanyl-D-alanine dipeptidase
MLVNFQKPGTILFSLFTSIFFFSQIRAQNISNDPGQLKIINDRKDYENQVKADSNLRMVNLTKMIPGLVIDLRYAGKNNFMSRAMYKKNLSYTFLRLPAARALAAVQSELASKGLGLKIYDAYRPYSVTVEFWNLVHDERYVANPAKGSGHNRGIAADLTIINLKSGKELDMGTGFDNFTDSAHHSFKQFPDSVLANRELLKTTMEKYGFHLFETEWWHYFWGDAEGFDVLDLDFKVLK